MLNRAVVFFALLAIAAAFMEIAQLDPIPQKFKGQQGCYIKELDIMLAFGSKVPSMERCVEYRCYERNVNIAGCSVMAVQHPCYLSTDESKPYPECCPKMMCP